MDFETIVVGGGIAGMSCALKLKEAGRDVALVTDELGGRVCYEPEFQSNFGAVFYMENYTNAKRLLSENHPMIADPSKLMLHTSTTKKFKGNSLTMMKSLPQMRKFQHFMKHEFIPEYSVYKKECETVQVKDALEKHPKIKRYYFMKASDLINELGIDRICDNFISKFAYACTGSKISELNALDFLNVVQGLIVPLFDFTFDREAFTQKLDGKVFTQTVNKVEKIDGGWRILAESGAALTSTYLVVATTGLVTQKLLNIDTIRQPTRLISYLVSGTPRADIAKAAAHYYSDVFDVIAINARPDKRFNVYSRAEIDLDQYFDNAEIIHFRDWPEALFTYGDQIQAQDWDENLWIAGDINGLGLEPAAISGIYAANRILGIA